jgi:hypothetical protein
VRLISKTHKDEQSERRESGDRAAYLCKSRFFHFYNSSLMAGLRRPFELAREFNVYRNA